MEELVKSLFERLNQPKKAQLMLIMDNAINEMHNNGLISGAPPEIAAKLHDPDPEIRVIEKTRLAKSVGYALVISSKLGANENGICHTIEIKNDERFSNSIAISIQGGLESLYQTGVCEKTKSGVMDYKVIIHKNGQDSSALENNIRILNSLYDTFNIHMVYGADVTLQNVQSDLKSDKEVAKTEDSSKENLLCKTSCFLSLSACIFFFTTGFLGVILGVFGLVKAIRNNEKGKFFAITGIVVGVIDIIVFFALIQ